MNLKWYEKYILKGKEYTLTTTQLEANVIRQTEKFMRYKWRDPYRPFWDDDPTYFAPNPKKGNRLRLR